MRLKVFIMLGLLLCAPLSGLAQEGSHDGLTNNLSNLYCVSNAKTRSISPENFTGEKGKCGISAELRADGARLRVRDTIQVAQIIGQPVVRTLLRQPGQGSTEQQPQHDKIS